MAGSQNPMKIQYAGAMVEVIHPVLRIGSLICTLVRKQTRVGRQASCYVLTKD